MDTSIAPSAGAITNQARDAMAAQRPRSGGPLRQWDRIAIGLVILGALALRLWHLTFQSLWWDEGVSIYLAGLDLRALTVAKDFTVDLHPPAYYLLLSAWCSLLGPSVFAVRLLSVFAGTVTVALVYVVARRLSSAGPALGAALLAALSPIDIYYSQEVRMYALLPVVGLLSLLATIAVIERPGRRAWLAWVAANAIGLYLYYYLGLLAAAEALLLLGLSLRRGALTSWLGAQSALILLYIPWGLIARAHLPSAALALPPETAVHLTLLTYLRDNWQDFTLGFSAPPGQMILLTLWTLGVVVGILRLARSHPTQLALFLLAVIIPLAGAGLIVLVRPFFYPRFILFVTAPLWILTGTGLASLPRLRSAGLLALAVLLAGSAWTDYHERTTLRRGYAPDDYRQVLPTLAAWARPGDVILCGYPWQVGYIQAYLPAVRLDAIFLPGHPSPELLQTVIAGYRRVWVYTYSPDRQTSESWIEGLLGQRYPTALVDQFGDTRIRLFTLSDTEPAVSGSSLATLGSEIALASAELSTTGPLRPGDILQITLHWQALRTPRDDYTVFVHLLGPDGKIHGQQDAPPLQGAFPTSRWRRGEIVIDRYAVPLPANAPVGSYQVEVGLYRPSNGQRLTVGPVPEADNRVIVGRFTIER
ncbi:MAG TPA: glycosyltransferase family 39 protein [Chloroflexota bacterium]|nr:glycosyltransferase family 39 protein [Chloroflexota bacterium]